jgi:hypothetical protein
MMKEVRAMASIALTPASCNIQACMKVRAMLAIALTSVSFLRLCYVLRKAQGRVEMDKSV